MKKTLKRNDKASMIYRSKSCGLIHATGVPDEGGYKWDRKDLKNG